MKKWEYLTAEVSATGDPFVFKYNSEAIGRVDMWGEAKFGKPLTEFLAERGNEGWEVAVSNQKKASSKYMIDTWIIIFKRPLE